MHAIIVHTIRQLAPSSFKCGQYGSSAPAGWVEGRLSSQGGRRNSDIDNGEQAIAEIQHHVPTVVSSFRGVPVPKRLGMGSCRPCPSHLRSLRN